MQNAGSDRAYYMQHTIVTLHVYTVSQNVSRTKISQFSDNFAV